jgi:hypothetical protein
MVTILAFLSIALVIKDCTSAMSAEETVTFEFPQQKACQNRALDVDRPVQKTNLKRH